MKVKHIPILGTVYSVREATKGELAQALRFSLEEDSEDFLVEKCLLAPRVNIETLYAGIPSRLAEEILTLSGVGEEAAAALQAEADAWVISPAGKIEALMMGILHLKPAEISNMYSEEWHKAASAAQLLAVALYNLPLNDYMAIGTAQEKKKPKNLPPTARQ